MCASYLYQNDEAYASLRTLGHTNSGYIDNSLLIGDNKQECENNVTDTVSLMTDLGFIIHVKKSVLFPTKTITFLGNIIDSEEMKVTLLKEKVFTLVQECRDLYGQRNSTRIFYL